MPTRTTNWEQIYQLAREAGAKYPELVAAQWALESGFGKHPAGRNNYWGLKATESEVGSTKPTTEVVEGKEVKIQARFIDFPSLEVGVQYLVDRWYKDFKSYKGVNREATREAAARKLVSYGYATDPDYAQKLIELMKENDLGGKLPKLGIAAQQKAILTIEALQPTYLKKAPVQAADLPEDEKVEVVQGRAYGVVELRERPADAHVEVVLSSGAGTWWIFEPHWRRQGGVTPPGSAGVDWSNFSASVTPHLTVGEVLQYDARRRPKAGSADERRILATAQQFEAMRRAWGRPLGVTSFYRPEPINQQVGGVPGSRHVSGEAMDVYPVGMPVDAFYQWIRVRWTGGLGDGRARGFVHLDTRNGGYFVPGAGVRPYVEFGY